MLFWQRFGNFDWLIDNTYRIRRWKECTRRIYAHASIVAFPVSGTHVCLPFRKFWHSRSNLKATTRFLWWMLNLFLRKSSLSVSKERRLFWRQGYEMILMRSKYVYSCDFGDIRLFYLNDFGKERKEDTGDSAQFNNIFFWINWWLSSYNDHKLIC